MILQIGVKVLLQRTDGNYLFIERTDILQDETTHSWDIPGGRIESHEDLRTALYREVAEETGISDIRELRLINAQDIFVPAKDLHVVRLTYRAQTTDTIVQLSDEHQKYSWHDLKAVKTMNIEPYLAETLRMLSA